MSNTQRSSKKFEEKTWLNCSFAEIIINTIFAKFNMTRMTFPIKSCAKNWRASSDETDNLLSQFAPHVNFFSCLHFFIISRRAIDVIRRRGPQNIREFVNINKRFSNKRSFKLKSQRNNEVKKMKPCDNKNIWRSCGTEEFYENV